MASDASISQLKDLSHEFKNVDRDDLLRVSLGEEALQEVFAPWLEEIQRRLEFAIKYASEVHDSQIQSFLGRVGNIKSAMEEQASLSNVEYVAQRSRFLETISANFEALRQLWPPFVTAAIEKLGFLENEDVRREYERMIESMKKESENISKQIQSEAQKIIAEAEARAERIEDRARLTATGISVEEAQKQFREAQPALDRQVKIWAGLSVVGIASFIITAICFANADVPDQWRWHVIYYSAIRVSILMAIGTVTAFCLKIFRAHLHMSKKNQHRQRVANSIGAFVDSAVTPEQRDLILSQLVESVIQFGSSGLLHREDDNVYRPKMTIDSIMRTLSTSSPKQ